MSTTPSATPSSPRQLTLEVTPALRPLVATAMLLERLDRLPRSADPASAEQYRGVVQQLARLLADTPAADLPGPTLDKLLLAFPGTAEVYENLHYGSAGLCRSPLDMALNAELDAAAAIRKARGARPAG